MLHKNGVNDIRNAFLDYFKAHGHEIRPSSSLVPVNDPTLMFTNAGMVQFKNVFTGQEKLNISRAVTSQKCVRAGGKHNDLDNVGYTARHHTFFEMLGNFSFGDYFKDTAIELAWNLITKEFQLPKDKLLVTVYSEDDEAFDLWKTIAGLSENKIIRIPTSDNFWSMGDTGPCGPCSEIFFDHGEHIPGGPPGSPDEDGDRFIEIWNLVFMQYEQIDSDRRHDLPRPSIDTGMGLERIAAVLQGKHDNYDIDLFQSLIHASEEATGVKAEGDKLASHRVIADHLRASSFLIADGVLPSNEGRGYVLRRIMRRAMRHAHLIGSKEPLLYRLFPTLLNEMGQAYGELSRAKALITETLKLEEIRFQKTLERGLSILDEEMVSLNKGDELSGTVAFKLYDTYGFPLDLTEDALRSRGISVDKAGFEKAMQQQKADARASWIGSGDTATETVWFDIRQEVGPTEFIGYDVTRLQGKITKIVKDGAPVNTLEQGDEACLVVSQTPFYGESGGQVGDTGFILAEHAKFRVRDVQKKADGVFVHYGVMEEGSLSVNDIVDLHVDEHRRQSVCSHHSATHIMHEALRLVLGDHVSQKGSLVSPDRLRFDFSHTKAVTGDEISSIEAIANSIVLQNAVVETKLMDVDEAIASGARALFGEKYGDEVRVVSMGHNSDDDKSIFSIELCGGTHVRRTGDIGLIKILSEGPVAAGVRRIEALTGRAAFDYLSAQDRAVRSLAQQLKTSADTVQSRIETLVEDKRRLEKELADLKRKNAAQTEGDTETISGIAFSGRILENVSGKELKSVADQMKSSLGSGVIVLISKGEDNKASVVVSVTPDLTSRLDAVQLVRKASEVLGGKGGGGRSDMAQAGGPDADKANEAIAAIRSILSQLA
jgi:alanyl-tRNA synthetase